MFIYLNKIHKIDLLIYLLSIIILIMTPIELNCQGITELESKNKIIKINKLQDSDDKQEQTKLPLEWKKIIYALTPEFSVDNNDSLSGQR